MLHRLTLKPSDMGISRLEAVKPQQGNDQSLEVSESQDLMLIRQDDSDNCKQNLDEVPRGAGAGPSDLNLGGSQKYETTTISKANKYVSEQEDIKIKKKMNITLIESGSTTDVTHVKQDKLFKSSKNAEGVVVTEGNINLHSKQMNITAATTYTVDSENLIEMDRKKAFSRKRCLSDSISPIAKIPNTTKYGKEVQLKQTIDGELNNSELIHDLTGSRKTYANITKDPKRLTNLPAVKTPYFPPGHQRYREGEVHQQQKQSLSQPLKNFDLKSTPTYNKVKNMGLWMYKNPNIKLVEYLNAVITVVGKFNIEQFGSRTTSKIEFYVKNETLADELYEKGINVLGTYVQVYHLVEKPERIVLNGIDYWFPNEPIVEALATFGEVSTGDIRKLNIGLEGMGHICTFRREVYIRLSEGKSPLPNKLFVNFEGVQHAFSLETGLIKCFACGNKGHVARVCRSTKKVTQPLTQVIREVGALPVIEKTYETYQKNNKTKVNDSVTNQEGHDTHLVDDLNKNQPSFQIETVPIISVPKFIEQEDIITDTQPVSEGSDEAVKRLEKLFQTEPSEELLSLREAMHSHFRNLQETESLYDSDSHRSDSEEDQKQWNDRENDNKSEKEPFELLIPKSKPKRIKQDDWIKLLALHDVIKHYKDTKSEIRLLKVPCRDREKVINRNKNHLKKLELYGHFFDSLEFIKEIQGQSTKKGEGSVSSMNSQENNV